MRALILVALLACGSSKSANDLPPEAWGVEDYAKAGIPAIDHAWTIDEHEAAAAALVKAAEGHPERLPRLQGAKSGPVFARIVEARGDDEFVAHARRFEAGNQISKLYMVNEMAAVNAEYLAIMGAMLREAAMLETGGEAFLASFGDDPSVPARRDGLRKMRSGWGQMLLGGVMILADVRVAEAARLAFAADLRAVFPTIYPKLQPSDQALIRSQLSRLHDGLTSGPLRDALPPLPAS